MNDTASRENNGSQAVNKRKVFTYFKDPQQLPDEYISELSVDSLIFGFSNGKLQVLLVKHSEGPSKDCWGLPGGWVKRTESIEDSASRLLTELTGVNDLFLEQLHVFSNVDRVDEGRVITVTFYAMIRPEDYELAVGHSAEQVGWFDVNEMPTLIYDHPEIVETGIQRLRHKVRHEPIGFNLLPQKFTLLQLQELYEAILNMKLDKPNFRRKMLKMKLLEPLNEKQSGVAHRAASLYRFDLDSYHQLEEKGFAFDI